MITKAYSKERTMYLAQLNISNFRKISTAKIDFQPGLDILVGANNVGKTAVIDALVVIRNMQGIFTSIL